MSPSSPDRTGPPRPIARARSSTIVHTGPVRTGVGLPGPPGVDIAAGTSSSRWRRQGTAPTGMTYTPTHALSHGLPTLAQPVSASQSPMGSLSNSSTPLPPHGDIHGLHGAGRHAPPITTSGTPSYPGHGHGHSARHPSHGAHGAQTPNPTVSHPHPTRPPHMRTSSAPSPPMPESSAFPNAPAVPSALRSPVVPTTALRSPVVEGRQLFGGGSLVPTSIFLSLYTYSGNATNTPAQQVASPSVLPAAPSPSRVLISYASLPWEVKPGDYLEIRRVKAPTLPVRRTGPGPKVDRQAEADAVSWIKEGRDGYIFRLGEDQPSVPMNQIQVPNSVAQAFKLLHRQDVEIVRIQDPESVCVDYLELNFSQYVGRADMWRLGMSLENTTVHVGEKVTLAGGAVRAEVQAIWRGRHRHSSGIVTAKTKTIYRSKSAQTYIFIQLCKETWDFDEDGERYYEKVLHGFLPDLFQRWTLTGASHLVTIVLFARVYYDDDDVDYLNRHDLSMGLMKDHCDRWCKDFFHVVVDFERKADWMPALADLKRRMDRSEREILLDFHRHQLRATGKETDEDPMRILGNWSFAYEGNVLEAINLALNPFDEHYVDRDLSRTGLSMTILTPGTGHFAVDKNLLRLTTERMIDHGIGLDLVCLTKMPLHSVPLFSYLSERPRKVADEGPADGIKTKASTPDPLYFDASMSNGCDRELTDCYSLAFWVYCSFYSKTHDKPFRKDRFVPRCKMYEIQMLGILDHNLTTVIVPMMDLEEANNTGKKRLTADDRKQMHTDYDMSIFGGNRKLTAIREQEDMASPSTGRSGGNSASLGTSYQSVRLLTAKADDERRGSTVPLSPRPPASRGSATSRMSITEEEGTSQPPSLPEVSGPLGSGSADIPDMPVARRPAAPLPSAIKKQPAGPSLTVPSSATDLATPRSRIVSMPPLSTSPSQSIASTENLPSGASTPRMTPAKRLKNQSSKGSFASRFASTWLFGSLGQRSQPSFPTAAVENVARQDVVTGVIVQGNSKPSSPAARAIESLPSSPPSTPPPTLPRPVPGARIEPLTPAKARRVSNAGTQPVPIQSQAARVYDDETPMARSMPRSQPRSLPHSVRLSKSMDDSWRNKTNAAFARTSQHTTVNPCNPKDQVITSTSSGGHGRRWQHLRPKMSTGKQHMVKWKSLCAPACLPLTTDFMPTPEEIAHYYEAHSYDIACFPDQVSFLIRPDAATVNLPLAVMREMASQRLSQNFQFIVLPHNSVNDGAATPVNQKDLLLGDAHMPNAGLRVGGASEVLKDASGAIYLSWSNHLHRLTFDPQKQSVTVQRFVRKVRHSTAAHAYKCLVWPYQLHGFQEATASFRYPNIDAKLNFNYLDRLIAGEEDKLQSNLRFWRTRYLLIPSGREPTSVSGVMPKAPKGEQYQESEILITGAMKVLELVARYQWKKPGDSATPLRLIATTFDPSVCVLDDGLMSELERLTSGKEKPDAGHTLEGMTMQAVADMMNKPNNGLIIRDRWWNFNVHEDSFTGEQFSQWLQATFADVTTREQAVEWGQSLFDKGLIEHVTGKHSFHDTYFFYRLRAPYASKPKNKSWFGKSSVQTPKTVIEQHALGTSPTARNAPLRLTEKPAKKRKLKMSQSIVIDLDPTRKSDRAEVAILHADIVHNARNAFHFELNWLGVTAGLLDELRVKCSTLGDRYGLRFVEAPVEQIKDVGQKCAYRAPIPIRLALAPPVIPDLHLRLTETSGSGQSDQFYEYAILTNKFGFVLDLEATERYPDTVEVEYAYRSKAKFEYSQFIHRSGLALVQCIGREEGFIWTDNRPFISAPTRGRTQSVEAYSGNLTPMASKQEQARILREEMEAFCSDPVALAKFYQEVTPPSPKMSAIIDDDDDYGDGWAGGSF